MRQYTGMNNASLVKCCPKCGASLPSEATDGLCPACLLAEALAPTQAGAEPVPSRSPIAPADLAPHFPQLEILKCLGRGGMGVVYKARQKSLNRFVALKLLAPERVGDAGFAERFRKEAQALAALNHPHIVTVYDFGQAGGFYFLLMEFVDGVNLRQAMRAGRFTPEQALAIVPPVCEALQYAHEHGIVHRDIKPENLLLDKEGRVKIADFGIAKMVGSGPGGGPDRTPATPPVSLSAGTPPYMAPEQKEHRVIDHRADIYSLGVVLYELLTGELPADKLQPPSRKVQIDVRLDEIVLRALERDPERRYQHASDVKTMVETLAQTPPSEVRAPDPGPAPAALERSRRLLAIRAVITCIVCAVFGLYLYPPIWGIGVAAWGLVGAVVIGRLAFGVRRNREEDRLALGRASTVGMVHALGMLSAGLWLALINRGLNPAWNHFLAGLCACGVLVLAVRLGKIVRLRKFCLATLPVTVVCLLTVHTFFLQSFMAATDALAPEVPRGSHVVVWKRASRFFPGDCIAYRQQEHVCLGRVASVDAENLAVLRNGEPDAVVPRGAVVGKVITVLWRGSSRALPRGSGMPCKPLQGTSVATASGGRLLEVGMTQDVVNDVQFDGTIRYDLTTTERNDSGRPLKAISFVNSDFIRVERVADARGRPLPFTTRREGRKTVRYEAALVDPVAPGAEYAYVTHGATTGQVTRLAERDVFEYAMRHWPATDVRVRRIERHLLPVGAALVVCEPAASVETNAAGRVMLTIDRLIPKGDSLETCYRYRLRSEGGGMRPEGVVKP